MSVSLASLIPTPLHPAVVHLPMALVILLPVFALVALIAVHRGARPLCTWGVAAAMFAALAISSWASIETGEDQENAVEKVVPKTALHTHEEAADTFLWLSVGMLGVAAVGLLNGRVGSSARILATAGTVVVLVAGYRVGHSGGELVYKHGAASAYTDSTGLRLSPESTNRGSN